MKEAQRNIATTLFDLNTTVRLRKSIKKRKSCNFKMTSSTITENLRFFIAAFVELSSHNATGTIKFPSRKYDTLLKHMSEISRIANMVF